MEPIAIIGIGCRFPGGASTPEGLWELLAGGKDVIAPAPAEREELYQAYDPQAAPTTPGKIVTTQGGFLDDIDVFDTAFFGIAPREAAHMDPQQRLLLEVAWESLEDAGLTPSTLAGSQTGVFVGMWTNDYQDSLYRDLMDIDLYTTTGTGRYAASGRISYALDLRGPTMTIDTACSSSLVAVHLACNALRNRECTLALVGGSNLILQPHISISYSRARLLSPDGRCKFADQGANGYVRSEGSALVVLKPLEQAIADGNQIYAVIRNSAVNNDGQSSGSFVAPGQETQEHLMRSVYHAAGVRPGQVQYVEAHGTGTTTGDKVELQAIGRVLSEGRKADQPCYVGSIKTNLGHTEAASGIAGLIKVALSLRHRQIPPSLHLHRPNPHIDWQKLPLIIPQDLVPWPAHDQPALAAVNSFGITGTNAHVLLEEAPEPAPSSCQHAFHLLTISAKSETALQHLAAQYQQHLTEHPGIHLHDLCATTHLGRTHFNHRLAVVASSTGLLAQQLETVSLQRARHGNRKIAFLFTGQGTQYAGMGRQLYECEPLFRNTLTHCAEILDTYLAVPLLDVLFAGLTLDDKSRLDETMYTQPALFALEYALAVQWQAWGIQPAALLGYGVGEYVAACLAGVFHLEDALKLVAMRGRLMQALPRNGQMIVVSASFEQVAPIIASYNTLASIAASNAPEEVVISGTREVIQRLQTYFAQHGIQVKDLPISHALHSPLLEPMLDEFTQIAAKIRYHSPSIDLVSSVTGQIVDDEVCSARYWRNQARQSISFMQGMQTLYERGCNVYLEIGPQPALLSMGRACLPHEKLLWLPSLHSKREDQLQLLESLGMLYVHHVPINWPGFEGATTHRTLSLPTYPFQRERYPLVHSRFSSEAGIASPSRAIAYPLLGRRLSSPTKEKQFEAVYSPTAFPLLQHHCLYDTIITPGACYLAAMVSAARVLLSREGCTLTDIDFLAAMSIPQHNQRTVRLIAEGEEAGSISLQVFSQETSSDDEVWARHAQASLRLKDNAEPPGHIDLAHLQLRCGQELPLQPLYQTLSASGLRLGPAFQRFTHFWLGTEEALGKLISSHETASLALIDPTSLDACFQSLYPLLFAAEHDQKRLYIPFSVQKLRYYRPLQGQLWCHVSLHKGAADNQEIYRGSAYLFNDAGEVFLSLEEFTLKAVSYATLFFQREAINNWLYTISWQAHPLSPLPGLQMPPALKKGTWFIFAHTNTWTDQVRQLLLERGEQSLLISPGERYLQVQPGHYQLSLDDVEDLQNLLRETAQQQDIQCRGIIHLLGVTAPALHLASCSTKEVTQRNEFLCTSVLHIVQAFSLLHTSRPPHLWIVTSGAQTVEDPTEVCSVEQTSLWGLGRVIAHEQTDLHCTLIDMDPVDSTQSSSMLIEALLGDKSEDQIALRQQAWYVPRLLRYTTPSSVPSQEQPLRLDIAERGILDNLALLPAVRQPPGPGEVEIAVSAAGLNFRDVLNALGKRPDDIGPLGMECAGEITALGAGVTERRVGEKVVAIAHGCFAHFVLADANLVLTRPSNLSAGEAATIPIPFLTAYYGLHHLAHISRGDRVLIHAAAGGVGIAALQLALQAGAEIFATVSTPEKVRILRALGVQHIMNSRNFDFVQEIMTLTDGQGVDIVLNSLANEFIPHSLSVLALGGRFVEIGKTDIWQPERVAALRDDICYYPFDLLEIFRQQPVLSRTMFTELMQQFSAGTLKPLPMSTYKLSDAQAAFRLMAQGKHIGKVILTIPQRRQQQNMAPASICQDATYLITGGWGGLGLIVARELIEQGARHLVLVGHGEPSDAARDTLQTYEHMGVQILTRQADVTDEQQVTTLLTSIATLCPPLKGIFHAAGILADGTLLRLDKQQFARVLAPKVIGAWNLHVQTAAYQLDFFVLFSSVVSLLGLAGQANYAAANAFLDGLAHLRHAQGLPAISINWGPWAGQGMVAAASNRSDRLAVLGLATFTAAEGTACLMPALQMPLAQLMVAKVNWDTLTKQPSYEVPASILQEFMGTHDRARLEEQTQTGTELHLLLEDAQPARQREILQAHVHDQVAKVLGLPLSQLIPEKRGLTELGMDSLMAVELRNRLQSSTGRRLVATLSYDYPNIRSIVAYLFSDVFTLKPGYVPVEALALPDDSSEQATQLKHIQELSENEIDDLLELELAALQRKGHAAEKRHHE